MAAGPIRRFTLFDAIALVAATAAGIAGARDEWTGLLRGELFKKPERGWEDWIILERIHGVCNLPLLCLVAWTFTVLGLRFKQPRPRRTRIILQFGTATCAAAAVSWLLGVGLHLGDTVLARLVGGGGGFSPVEWWVTFLGAMESTRLGVASGVLVAWMILGWSRLGRCEASWIDRVGRALGVLWILMGLNELLEHTCWHLTPHAF